MSNLLLNCQRLLNIVSKSLKQAGYYYICTVYILKIHEQPYSRDCILVVNKLALEVVGREFEPRLSQDLI